MSKIFLILLSVFVLISFVACSQAPQDDSETTEDTVDVDTTEVEDEEIIAEIELDSDEYAPGEIIIVIYSSPENIEDDAWIGMLPANVEHGDEEVCDEYDLDFHLIDPGDKDEVVEFTAPDEPGLYDIRMFDSDWEGEEILSITFEVTDDAEEEIVGEDIYIELDESIYSPEELILITYYAPEDIEDDAWIGIIPSEIEHGEESVCDEHDLDYDYIEPGEGSTDFYAPVEPGSYDIRMFTSDFDGDEIISISFEVEE